MSESERIPNLIEEALSALRREQYARAVAIADQLAVDLPNHALVRAIRAQGLLYGDDPEAALAEAQAAVELEPANAHSQILLGYAAWRCERPAMAESAFEAAVRRSGREPFFLAEVAWFLANERAPKTAEAAAREAIDADADSSTAWAALGLAQFRMHQREEAENSLRRALALNPHDIYAQSAMVALLQEQGKTKEAESLAEVVSEHAGAEDLADTLRQDAKERKIAAMLLERNIDLDAPPPEHPWRIWLAIVFASCSMGGIILCLDPHRWLTALLFAAVPPLLIWVYLKMWE
jgi:Tfp pilus assembly protein PilF